MDSQTLQSGDLRQRVKFLQGVARDEGGQEIEDPVVILEDVPASIRAVSGDESLRGPQVVAGATHLVTTRFFHLVETTPDMHILVPRDPPGGGKTRRLNILRTIDPDYTRRQLLHYCLEQPLANG